MKQMSEREEKGDSREAIDFAPLEIAVPLLNRIHCFLKQNKVREATSVT